MTQEEIWINHIKETSLEDVIQEYNNPAIFQQELVSLINSSLGENKKIIEVGCELGATSMLISKKFDKTLLDLNPLAIELTKSAHKRLNLKANFIIADMFNMPFEDKQYDVLFNAGVIEHFNKEERKEAFKEYKRVLKDNGVMYIAFPNHYSLPYRVSYKIRKILNKWPYPAEFKMFDLIDEIKENNLVLERRVTLSKKSLMSWLDFLLPLKWLFHGLDKMYNFEGYLTVLIIRKKN